MRRRAAIALLAACTKAPPPPPPVIADAAPSAMPSAATVVPTKTKRGGTDVTFTAVSDTHFGFGGMPEAHAVLIPALNSIAGKAYPTALGGSVAPPRGLVITGDLTEWGWPEQWPMFESTYAKLKFPVYEVEGNHDKVSAHFIEEQIAKRHGSRFYSYDWDDLHMVALGEAPDDAGFAFLESDLAKVALDVPVILYFHLALAGPWSDNNWFAEGTFKQRLKAVAHRWNVIAIFHGHHHATDHYVYDGIDVFKPGAVKGGAHTFAVVHVTDDRMTVAEYDWDNARWAGTFTKQLTPRTR